jgi:hypothetical protein
MTARLPTPSVPVSWGELIDKLTILTIKQARIADEAARANIARERDALETVAAPALARSGVTTLVAELTEVNETLWAIEDDIRLCEARADFGAEFVRLARAVYHTNDRRAAVKRALNDLLASELVEEKSYAATTAGARSLSERSVAPHPPTTSRVTEAGSTAKR